MSSKPRNRAEQRAARELAAREGISYQRAVQRLRNAGDAVIVRPLRGVKKHLATDWYAYEPEGIRREVVIGAFIGDVLAGTMVLSLPEDAMWGRDTEVSVGPFAFEHNPNEDDCSTLEGTAIELGGLHVLPEYRRRGVMRAMVDYAAHIGLPIYTYFRDDQQDIKRWFKRTYPDATEVEDGLFSNALLSWRMAYDDSLLEAEATVQVKATVSVRLLPPGEESEDGGTYTDEDVIELAGRFATAVAQDATRVPYVGPDNLRECGLAVEAVKVAEIPGTSGDQDRRVFEVTATMAIADSEVLTSAASLIRLRDWFDMRMIISPEEALMELFPESDEEWSEYDWWVHVEVSGRAFGDVTLDKQPSPDWIR